MRYLGSILRWGWVPTLTVVLLLSFACGFNTWDPTLHYTDRTISTSGAEVLKVHLNSGDLVLLQSWNAATPDTVVGQGVALRYRSGSDLEAAGIPDSVK